MRPFVFVLALIAPARAAWAQPAESPPTADVGVEARLEALQKQLAAQQQQIADLQSAQELASVVPAEEAKFELHGFVDMGLQHTWATDTSDFASTKTTFVLGNVNLYFGFHPAPHWSALAEVRFTNYTQQDAAAVVDPANGIGDDTVRLGAMVLERAVIQYQRDRGFGLRVGELLTPFGIWNADHGTPTLITIVRPESMTTEMFPVHQLGAEVFGERTDVLPGWWALEYHAYVSNGRTGLGSVDVTNDKMVGGRLIAQRSHGNRLAFGVSALWGHNTAVIDDATASSKEVVLGADASVDFDHLRLRGEVTYRDVHDQGADIALAAATTSVSQHAHEGDAYALAGYRVGTSRYEPYVYAEGLRMPDPEGDVQLMGAVGLNVYFTTAIQLKLELLHDRRYESSAFDLAHETETETFAGGKLVMGL